MKLALIRLLDRLPAEVRMLLPIHDGVLLELPADMVEETSQIVREAMEAVPDGFAMPLKIDIKIGRMWGECT